MKKITEKMFCTALNNSMVEQIRNFRTASSSLRYAVESALIDIMNVMEVDIIVLEEDNHIDLEINEWITSILKHQDEDGDDVISFEILTENEDDTFTTETKRLYRFEGQTLIDVWETIMKIKNIITD